MRHYMVDPDNEERLLKIPPHVVAAIKDEAYAEAREAVAALPKMNLSRGVIATDVLSPLYVVNRDQALDAIDALREEQK